jgi:hypothetical protein
MNTIDDEKILNWVSDFCQSDSLSLFPSAIKEHAQSVLESLLREAINHGAPSLEQLSETTLQSSMLKGVARLRITEDAKAYVPSLCRAFLEDLQRRGRIGNGLTLGRYVGALKQAFIEASSEKATTFQRPGIKIGRNDPCPCGSGLKYKKCCGKSEG